MTNNLSLRKQNSPKYNPKFFENRVKFVKEKSIIAKENYLLNPTICKHCKTILPYKSRHNKFCNKSCAAYFNNALRTPEEHKKRILKIKESYKSLNVIDKKQRDIEYQKKSRLKRKGLVGLVSSIYYIECKKCKKVFTHHGRIRLYCHQCPMEDRKLYRAACKFNLNNRDHTFLFNSELIKKYGWYSPTNSSKPNVEGVTWDHLFRIEDGFILNISPKIMKHPANAELIPWKKNVGRRKSLITYDELLKRIKWYENGEFEKLIYFYFD